MKAPTLRCLLLNSFAEHQVFCLPAQVCECVVIMRNLKDVSWAGAKSMMADPGFLKSLVEFDKDGLTEKQVGGWLSRTVVLLLALPWCAADVSPTTCLSSYRPEWSSSEAQLLFTRFPL